jgi:hypothetical protein
MLRRRDARVSPPTGDDAIDALLAPIFTGADQ